MKRILCLIAVLLSSGLLFGAEPALLGPGWNPKAAADEVMSRLIKVTAPEVKGAHDAQFVIVGDRAFIVALANDLQPAENPEWPFIYCSLSIVNVKTMQLEKVIPFAHGEQVYANETLPPGACFVPRILQKDAHSLRCYFTSEEPHKRQSQGWYLDFDVDHLAFENQIHKTKIKTAAGTFEMQPQYFYQDAVAHGFQRPPVDYGIYAFDSFKVIDGKTYTTVNNYPGGQNSLAVLNDALDTFEILGQFDEPGDLKLTESAVNRLPDGTWLAICRQEAGDHNYTFSSSLDGRKWSPNEHRPFVSNGAGSKPTFDCFHGVYYLGWQDGTKINGVNRSVFNVDVSRDGVNWERKYRFESEHSFQYPSFHEKDGAIYLTVTQGDTDASRKERIMFGKLE